MEQSVVRAMAASSWRSASKRPISLLAKRCESLAEPPLPQASILPPLIRLLVIVSMAAAMGAASISTAFSWVWALSSKCWATRAIKSIWFKGLWGCESAHSTSQLGEDFECQPLPWIFVVAQGRHAGGQAVAGINRRGNGPVLRAWHVAQLVTAPVD